MSFAIKNRTLLSSKNGAATGKEASEQLSARENRLRLAGETLTLAALLLLLVGLYAWRQISGFDYLQYNMIHVPDIAAQASYLKPILESSDLPEFRNVPAGNPLFTIMLLFGAFSALTRRRTLMIWSFFAFCMVPWAIGGLVVPGVQVTASMILIFQAIAALRHGDRNRAGILGAAFIGVWFYFDLPIMNPMGEQNSKPTVLLSATNPAARLLTPSTDLTAFQQGMTGKREKSRDKKPRTYRDKEKAGFAGLNGDPGLPEGVRAYVVAQEAFFHADPQRVVANLTPAMIYFSQPGSFENNRLLALQNYLASKKIGDTSVVAAYETRRSAVHMLSVVLLSLAGFAAFCGALLETLAGWIVRRNLRLDKLRARIGAMATEARPAAGPTGKSLPSSVTTGLGGVRILKRRVLIMLVMAAPLVAASIVLGLFSLHLSLPVPTANGAFDKAHILPPAFSGFPHGYLNVTPDQLDFLAPPTGSFMIYFLLLLANVIALALRRYRYLAMIFLCSVGYVQYDLYLSSRAGMIELPISDIKPSTLEAMRSYVSHPAKREDADADQHDRNAAAYGYLLAQVAYIRGQATDVQTYLADSQVLGYWAIPSTEWRVSAMQEWLAANGVSIKAGAEAKPLVSPAEFRLFSMTLREIALILLVLALPFFVMAGTLHWRRLRIDALIVEYGSTLAARTAARI